MKLPANHKRRSSLRFRIGIAFALVTVPLILLLIYNNLYASNVVRNQVAQSNKKFASLYLNPIDRSLAEADQYLYSLASQDSDLLALDLSPEKNNRKYYLAKIRLSNKISADIVNYEALDMLFIYSIINDEMVMSPVEGKSYPEQLRERTAIYALLKEGASVERECLRSWCTRQIGEQYFLLHIVKAGNVYLGAWVEANRLLAPLDTIELGDRSRAILVTDRYEPMNDGRLIDEQGIRLEIGNELYTVVGAKEKYLLVGETSRMGNFGLAVLIPERTILEKLPELQRIAFLVPLAAVLVLLLLLLYLRKIILRPINRFISAMKRFRNGNWDTQVAPDPSLSQEFELMTGTFNSMVTQIQDLKINVYEEQLNLKRAELKHLQLQINPHFFLNSLNILFHLAQSKQYELIKEMTVNLVEYFRFMFRSASTFVKLEEELRHTSSYLKIQQLRFPEHMTFRMAFPEDLAEVRIPPLLIQSFVENTIKHAVTMDETIHLEVTIEEAGEGEKPDTIIRIRDNGPGFPADVLDKLRSGEERIKDNGEQVGIWNARRRLSLLYGDRASLSFRNGPVGGAIVEIRLPRLEHEE
ncbi:histidine kinase [Cohnella boryungensis]|uniref:Sensor histidine kinase n=1 Tax=Cohnella boryungensis TaxID=768479 RepID=A0ABV8S3P3_9BACL